MRCYIETYREAKEASRVKSLHVAAYFGLEDLSKQLLDTKVVDVNSATSMGTTTLIHASASGRIAFLKMLLKEGRILERRIGMVLLFIAGRNPARCHLSSSY